MTKDVTPDIYIDKGLDDIADTVEIDIDAVVAYMQARGFTDEQISKTRIAIDSIYTAEESVEQDPMVTSGRFFRWSKLIKLYPRADIIDMIYRLEEFNASQKEHFDAAEAQLSRKYSKDLAHEIEHYAISEIEGGMVKENLLHIGRSALKAVAVFGATYIATNRASRSLIKDIGVVPNSISGIIAKAVAVSVAAGIASRTGKVEELKDSFYYTMPEEVRCREAAQVAPINLVTIRPRHNFDTPTND